MKQQTQQHTIYKEGNQYTLYLGNILHQKSDPFPERIIDELNKAESGDKLLISIKSIRDDIDEVIKYRDVITKNFPPENITTEITSCGYLAGLHIFSLGTKRVVKHNGYIVNEELHQDTSDYTETTAEELLKQGLATKILSRDE